MSGEVRLVLVTAPESHAHGLARALVEARLAACVNLLPPMDSVFRWENRIEEAREHLLVIKTTRTRLHELRSRVQELHPYDVPEFVELPVAGGIAAYLDWVAAETVGTE
jgi:periplasmic divalent cation tolerance protein